MLQANAPPCPKCGTIMIRRSAKHHCLNCDGDPGPMEAVDHPYHYGGADNPYEVIKVIEAWELGLSSPTAGFNLGNAVKYIGRASKKGKCLEDLKKAAWYLQREIENLEHVGGQ